MEDFFTYCDSIRPGIKEAFCENNIDFEALLLLGPDELKELVPKIGERVKIQKYIKNQIQDDTLTFSLLDPDFLATPPLRTTLKTPYDPENDNEDVASLPASASDIQEIQYTGKEKSVSSLPASGSDYKNSESVDGRVILKEGKSSQGLLKEGSRRKLSQLIINKILETSSDIKITAEQFDKLATEIITIFPKESNVVYYSPYQKDGNVKKNASGKLYETYVTKRRKYRVTGVLPATSRSSSRSSTLTSTESNEGNDDNENITWLKNNVDPWKTVEEKWVETQKQRLSHIYEGDIAKYYNNYPALKQPQGYCLLQQDFKYLYPGKESRLFSMIDTKKEEIIAYAKDKAQQTRDKYCSAAISNLIGLIDENDPETATNVALLLLAHIINISPARKRKGKAVIKFSRAEICDAYIKQVASEADVTSNIISKREQVAKQGRTLQPFVIFVGQSVTKITTAYVVINDTLYHFNKLITAIDCAFKVFQSTGACYPEECTDIWLLIQIGFFDIKTKFDKNCQAVNSLLTDLGLISKQ